MNLATPHCDLHSSLGIEYLVAKYVVYIMYANFSIVHWYLCIYIYVVPCIVVTVWCLVFCCMSRQRCSELSTYQIHPDRPTKLLLFYWKNPCISLCTTMCTQGDLCFSRNLRLFCRNLFHRSSHSVQNECLHFASLYLRYLSNLHSLFLRCPRLLQCI